MNTEFTWGLIYGHVNKTFFGVQWPSSNATEVCQKQLFHDSSIRKAYPTDSATEVSLTVVIKQEECWLARSSTVALWDIPEYLHFYRYHATQNGLPMHWFCPRLKCPLLNRPEAVCPLSRPLETWDPEAKSAGHTGSIMPLELPARSMLPEPVGMQVLYLLSESNAPYHIFIFS